MLFAVLVSEHGGNPAMPKYGLFSGNMKDPMQTYEGDSMAMDKEYVYIYKNEPSATGTSRRERQVAAIKLADGQSVKEIQ
jgi:hypothetical protein